MERKYNYSVNDISAEDFYQLLHDEDEKSNMCTIETGMATGLDIDYDFEGEGMLVSGDDELHIMTFVAMCYVALEREGAYELFFQLIAMKKAEEEAA